jgi:fatty acid amide hydrolase
MVHAHQIAREIAFGKVSAREAVVACIERIESTQTAINAVVVPRFEQALKEADLADGLRARGDALGPLHGVPITIKESFDLTGTATTAGLTNRAGHRAAADAAVVARLRQAGAIVLGKTNVSQLLLHDACRNPLYGRTNNPWQLDRSPGASSGGEAAILAVGGSALGIGSDIGGSVRLPAVVCGVTRSSLRRADYRWKDTYRSFLFRNL